MSENSVWKFKIEDKTGDTQMPIGTKVLSINLQDGDLYVWALIDGQHPFEYETRHFEAYGTGYKFNAEGLTYITTIITDQSKTVFHVFEKLPLDN